MITGKAKVSAKGWVVIPKEIRERMDLRPGDEVRLLFDEDSLRVLKIPKDAVAATRGKYKDLGGGDWLEALLQERRREREREDRKALRGSAARRTSA